MTNVRLVACALGTAAGLGMNTAAFGQVIGPSIGTVEFRWRERSTPGYNGSYTVGPWVTPGVDAVPTPNPSAASVTAQDASVVLVLETRVTAAPGVTTNPIRGLYSGEFGIITNQASGGAFARQNITAQLPELNPRANARVNTLNLGFDPSTLVNFPLSGIPRGVVSPFRATADRFGPSTNTPDIGTVTGNANAIRGIATVLQSEFLAPENIDATNPGEYDLAGLNTWVPVYIAIYTITDVTTPRSIVFTMERPDVEQGGGQWDYALRTWRGVTNPDNGFADSWQLLPGFAQPPTFTVHVVPGPGVGGAMGLAGLAVLGRRRR